jgi:hypothetical protein
MHSSTAVNDHHSSEANSFNSLSPRTIGIAIAVAGLLSVLLMTHHPSVGSHAIADAVDEIATKAVTSKVVHGTLIALMVALIYAFVEFSAHLGLRRAPVRAALIAYVIGSGALIGAALISGFLISSLGLVYAHARPDELDAMRHLLNLSGLANRTLANFGVVAISAAILLWSIALLQREPRHVWIGLLGVIAAVAPVALIALDIIRLDVSGMTIVVVCQTVWYVLVGVALASGKI